MSHLKTNDQIILKFDPGVYTKSCWASFFHFPFLPSSSSSSSPPPTSLESPLYIKIKLNFPNSEMVHVNACA